MTVIRPNSISGVTSITAQANEINVFRHNGVLAGLQLNGVNHHTSAGVSTFHTVNILGNLDVAGVLTYQDVTNVDSVGIITARSGINVSGGQLDVGSNIKLGNAGVITATSFVASGTIETTGNELKITGAEPRLTFTDTDNNPDFQIWANAQKFAIYDSTNSATRFHIDSSGNIGINNTTPSSKLHVNGTARFEDDVSIASTKKLFTNSSQGQLTIQGGATYPGSAIKFAGGQSGATDQGQMIFYAGTATSLEERVRIASNGGVGIATDKIPRNYFLHIAAPSQDYTNSSTQLTDGGGIMFQHTDTLASTGRTYPGIFWSGNTSALGRARAGIIGVTASNNDATHIAFLTRIAANGTSFYPSDERFRIKSDGHLKHTGLRSGNNENKLANLTTPSYNTSEEDVALYIAENESSSNQITFGGGSGSYNAATQIRFLTAPAVNTTTGTERLRIDSSGRVSIGDNNAQTAYPFYVAKDLNNGGNLLSFGNTDSTYSQSLTLSFDSNKDMKWAGGSGSGGLIWDVGTRGHVFKINGSDRLQIHNNGGLQIGSIGNVSAFVPNASGINGGLMFTTPVYSEYHYTWSGHSSYTIDLTCASYFHAEFIYVQHQTNGGTGMHHYVRGKWANNHQTHTCIIHEYSGDGAGLDVTFVASDQSGNGAINGESNMTARGAGGDGYTNGGGENYANTSSANGRLRITETYNWGSVSSRGLIVRVFFGSFAISKS